MGRSCRLIRPASNGVHVVRDGASVLGVVGLGNKPAMSVFNQRWCSKRTSTESGYVEWPETDWMNQTCAMDVVMRMHKVGPSVRSASITPIG